MGGHDATTRIVIVFQQLAEDGRICVVHQVEEFFALLHGQVAEQVRRVVRRHLLNQIGKELVIEISGDAQHRRRV